MKFNLKTFAAKQPQDVHETAESRLTKEHSEAPEEITENQLDKDRVGEKNVLTEQLLEKSRTGGSDKITEKNLNDSKSKLVQHRNTEASAGDINKLEEQRVDQKKKVEAETTEPASTTPKKRRWWEQLKAGSSRRKVIAQELDFSEDAEWGRVPGTWSEEEGLIEDKTMDLPTDFAVEETGVEPLSIDQIKPVDSPIAKGLFVSFDVNEGSKMGVEELQERAYKMTLDEGYDYLSSIPEFTPASFSLRDGKMIARLVGDEYYPSGKAGYEEENINVNLFNVAELQKTDVEGIVLGVVNVDPEMLENVQDMDDEDIRNQVTEAIESKHEHVTVTPDGIDLDSIASGEISYVGEVAVKKRGPKTESWENVKGDPIASTDFDIVVLSDVKSDTKKN